MASSRRKRLDKLVFAAVLVAVFASTLGGLVTFIPMAVGLILGLLWAHT